MYTKETNKQKAAATTTNVDRSRWLSFQNFPTIRKAKTKKKETNTKI